MTATDELRAMLDERGVIWDYGPSGASSTAFWVNGKELSFSNWRDGLVCSTIFTPAQAIAATLGAGTCQGHTYKEYVECSLVTFNCMACGWEGIVDSGFVDYSSKGSDMPNYCPNCGRRVVEK